MCSSTALSNIADPLKINRGSGATLGDPLNIRNATPMKLGADGLPVKPTPEPLPTPVEGKKAVHTPTTSAGTGLQIR